MQSAEIVTDDTLRELKQHGSLGYPFSYYLDDISASINGLIDWHWHREIEIVLVQRGEVDCLVGESRTALRLGDGAFINSGVVHCFETSGRLLLANILFDPEFIAPVHSLLHDKFIAPLLGSSFSHVLLRREIPWQRALLDLMAEICALSAGDSPTRELEIHALACRLWLLLYAHMQELVSIEKVGSSMRTQSRLRAMLAYIERHYSRRLTLDEIARAANISKSEALRCFKASMRTSPIAYLNLFRLRAAHKLLLSTENTVLDIAAAVGFDSVSYFDRLFKRQFGLSPKALRRSPPDVP